MSGRKRKAEEVSFQTAREIALALPGVEEGTLTVHFFDRD